MIWVECKKPCFIHIAKGKEIVFWKFYLSKMTWLKSEYLTINSSWNVSPDFETKSYLRWNSNVLLLKNYFFSSKQCFSTAGRLGGLVNADGKRRRISHDPGFINLGLGIFQHANLILVLPNLVQLLLVAFFFQWLSSEISCPLGFSRSQWRQMYNLVPIFVWTAFYNFRSVLGTWTKANVLPINHAHWCLWLYLWYVSACCASCSWTIPIYIHSLLQ